MIKHQQYLINVSTTEAVTKNNSPRQHDEKPILSLFDGRRCFTAVLTRCHFHNHKARQQAYIILCTREHYIYNYHFDRLSFLTLTEWRKTGQPADFFK